MKKLPPDLEKEMAEYIYGEDLKDFRSAHELFLEDPWLALTMYEEVATPDLLDYPVAWINKIGGERASEGMYFDKETGKSMVVNRYGRIMNEFEYYGEKEDEEGEQDDTD